MLATLPLSEQLYTNVQFVPIFFLAGIGRQSERLSRRSVLISSPHVQLIML